MTVPTGILRTRKLCTKIPTIPSASTARTCKYAPSLLGKHTHLFIFSGSVFTRAEKIANHHCICTICGDTVTEAQRQSGEPHCRPCTRCGEIRTPDQPDHLCFRTNTVAPYQFYMSVTLLSLRKRPLNYHGCEAYEMNSVISLKSVSERPIILFVEGPKCSLPFLVDYVPMGKLKIRPALENHSLYNRYRIEATAYTFRCRMPSSFKEYSDCSYVAHLPPGCMYDTLQITSIEFGVSPPPPHPCLKSNPPARRGMYCIVRLDGGTSKCIFHVKRLSAGRVFKCASCDTSTTEPSYEALIKAHFSKYTIGSYSPLLRFSNDGGRSSFDVVKPQ